MPKLTVLTIEADLSEIVEGRHWMPAVVASRIDGRSHPLTSSQKNRRRRKGGGSSDFTYVRLKFSDPVDTLALGNALSDIVSRHEALFSVFGSDERIPVTPLGTAFVPVIDVPTDSITEWTNSILQQFHRPYYLAHWPLFRWVLLRERTGSLFLWQISHMVVDLPGVDILEREIAIAYEARICGESPSLPTVPYVTDDYVADLAALTYHPSVLSQLDSDLRQYNDAVGICKEILSTRRDFGAHVGHLLPDVYPDRIDPYAIIAAMATAVGVWLSIDIVPVRIGTTGRTYRALPCDYARLVSQANDHYLIPADVSSRLVGEVRTHVVTKLSWARQHSLNMDKVLVERPEPFSATLENGHVLSIGLLGQLTVVESPHRLVCSIPRPLWGSSSFASRSLLGGLKIGLFSFQKAGTRFHLHTMGIDGESTCELVALFQAELAASGIDVWRKGTRQAA